MWMCPVSSPSYIGSLDVPSCSLPDDDENVKTLKLSLYEILCLSLSLSFFFFCQFQFCPELPFVLWSFFFSPVIYGCVQDDCNAAKTSAMVSFSDQTKREGGFSSRPARRFKASLCFQDLDRIGSVAVATSVSKRGREEKNLHRETDTE